MIKEVKLSYGVGINDFEGQVNINGKKIKSYQVWKNMLARCYSEKIHNKRPTYIGCLVCDEWLYFSNFKKWFDENYRWDLDEKGLRPCLDKDLLVEGNKMYSPETCIFIPNKVNGFLTNKQLNNVSGYAGIGFFKISNKWRVQIKDFTTNKNKHIGLFDDIEVATKAYNRARTLEVEKCREYMKNLGYDDKIISKIR